MFGTAWSAPDIVALVGVVLAGVPGIIAAVYARKAHQEVKSPNGETRTTGTVIHDIADTVQQNGTPPTTGD